MSEQLPPFTLQPIGKIWTGFKSREECPRNSRFNESESVIDVDPAYADAFLGLEAGRHIAVLYWFDKADRTQLQTTPPNAEKQYGVFATRSPHRPNPIALSAVKIYVPMIDAPEEASATLPWTHKH